MVHVLGDSGSGVVSKIEHYVPLEVESLDDLQQSFGVLWCIGRARYNQFRSRPYQTHGFDQEMLTFPSVDAPPREKVTIVPPILEQFWMIQRRHQDLGVKAVGSRT